VFVCVACVRDHGMEKCWPGRAAGAGCAGRCACKSETGQEEVSHEWGACRRTTA
jgi:hypothetical protein